MAVAQHATSSERKIDLAKRIVATILQLRKGPEKAISSEELAGRTPVRATTIRDIIPEIIDECNLPIGSCPDGYYLIDDPDQFRREMHRYESQRDTARERMRRLSRAFYGQQEVWA